VARRPTDRSCSPPQHSSKSIARGSFTASERGLLGPEEHLWRAWTQLSAELSATLQREMQSGAKLSMSDNEVLIHLTDSPEGRVRVSDLARLLQCERSRVSP